MIRSLIKNLLITNCTVCAFVAAANAAKYNYEIDFDARYGNHYYGPPTTATDRYSLEFEQKAIFDKNWSGILGFRGEVEAAYASVPERYANTDVAKYDSQDFFLRDNYIQFQNGSFRARAGYQQVVWGEAFGSYYADIVNPKDYREAGIGNLSRNRLDSPLLNLQWIFSNTSVQGLYIPKAYHNIMPSSGSDFNPFLVPAGLSNYALTVNRDSNNPPTGGEYGFRFTQQISSYDFSLFYLNYYDRTPVYELQINPALSTLTASPDYKALETYGGTLTVDANGYLLRTEILENLHRSFNTATATGIDIASSNELVYVLGVDLPSFAKWQFGLQYSESRLADQNWYGRSNLQSIASARVAKVFSNEIGFEALLTDFTQDASSLIQAQLNFPLSSQIEFLFGIDKFGGGSDTYLGRIKDASRVWVMLRGSIKK